jgi:hypothetical protein
MTWIAKAAACHQELPAELMHHLVWEAQEQQQKSVCRAVHMGYMCSHFGHAGRYSYVPLKINKPHSHDGVGVLGGPSLPESVDPPRQAGTTDTYVERCILRSRHLQRYK